jgi:hypothetical protein
MKTMLIFFNIKGIVCFEFMLQGHTVNQAYMDILKRLRETVGRKRSGLIPSDWILHRDSASAHKAPFVKEFLAQKSIIEIERPPCSLIWLRMTSVSKMKSAFRGRRFQILKTSPPPKKKVATALKTITQQEFQKCFQQWQHRWAKCIDAEGDRGYLEGDPYQETVFLQ